MRLSNFTSHISLVSSTWIMHRATDRISSQLFKQAVETNMLTRIVAFEYELSKDEYDKMRSKAVAAVKRSTGRISLFDTMQDSEE